jgi:O-antigen/teichoic acid export membrane protein
MKNPALPEDNTRSGSWTPGISRRVWTIAAGEGIARAGNLLLAVFIARVFGVRAAGAYALAQALALYQMQGTDFGLRHIGARLIAQNPDSGKRITRLVQRRRALLALLMVTLGCLYGWIGPVPKDTRFVVSLYAVSMFGYGFSLDWLAWGMQRFALMSGWRAVVALLSVGTTIACVRYLHAGLLIIALANGLAYLAADFLLWSCWARRLPVPETHADTVQLAGSGWKPMAMLGTALLLNQAFNSIDTMMLGSLTDSAQTGLYSAAYRLLLLVLAMYYLGLQAIYPQIAAKARMDMHAIWRLLSVVVTVGIVAAAAMEWIRGPLIALFYGRAFAASALLAGPLLLAIPLDFATSFLVTVLIAWDYPRRVLMATAAAVTSNVLLNCFLIPRYKATGAAWATPLSYLPFLVVLLWHVRRVSRKGFGDRAESDAAMGNEQAAALTGAHV